MKIILMLGFGTMLVAAPLAAQEPTPTPTPAPAPAPAPAAPAPATPAAMPTPAWAPVATTIGVNRRGWFGISLTCGDCYVQRGAGRVAYTQRPAINWVESGSPAYQAGLRAGDTLVSVDGLQLTTPEGFERFANALSGTSVRVGIRRGGQDREFTVVPGTNPSLASAQDYYNERLRTAQRNGFTALRSAFRSPLGSLGLGVQCSQCTVSSGRRAQAWSFQEPPVIITVDVDGPAHRALLRRGDTLTAMDGVDLTTPQGGRAFGSIEPGQRVTITYRRAGTERRITLVAVAQPDASPEELATFEEYRRMRDSSVATYREQMTTSVARLQAEARDMERMLRELESNRGAMDSSQRRLASLDSLVRAMRGIERARAYGSGNSEGFSYAYATSPTPMTGAVYATAPMAATIAGGVAGGVRGAVYPLRYSGRLKDLANVEVRALGAPTISEVGDSLIVVTASGVEVKVALRAAGAVRRR
jgi:hypothetical protein